MNKKSKRKPQRQGENQSSTFAIKRNNHNATKGERAMQQFKMISK